MTAINRITIGSPVSAKNHTAIPIEATSISYNVDGNRCWCNCSKQLLAIVVLTPSETLAFDMKTGPIAIRELKKNVPEIENFLKRIKQ